MTETAATPETTDTELVHNDRRALLRKIAIGGAGAAAGAVMLSNNRASAADGNTLLLGSDAAQTANNTTSTPTIIDFTPGTAPTEGPSALSVGGYVPPATSPFPAAVGGYGDASIANGVHGSTTAAAGFGVVAANLAAASAATAAAPAGGLAVASANGAQIRFVPLTGAVTGPTPGVHAAGELYADKDGTLWFTVPTATTGVVRFVKLAGTPTAGSFHAIDPQRVYDSRQPGYAAALRGVMAPNTSRVISVADGRSENGTIITAAVNAVPAGATAVHINVTVANMTGPNFLSVAAGDKATTPVASVINWSATDIQIANAITVPVDASRQIKVFCGNQTGSTDVIVDVFGYYL